MIDVKGSPVASGSPNELWSYGEETYKIML